MVLAKRTPRTVALDQFAPLEVLDALKTSAGATFVVARWKNLRAAPASRRGETNTSIDLPELIDRAVDVAPMTRDLHIGLMALLRWPWTVGAVRLRP